MGGVSKPLFGNQNFTISRVKIEVPVCCCICRVEFFILVVWASSEPQSTTVTRLLTLNHRMEENKENPYSRSLSFGLFSHDVRSISKLEGIRRGGYRRAL